MTNPTIKAKVKRLTQLTHDVRELIFELVEPAEMPFVSGQYINFRMMDPERDKMVSRLYSISTAPAQTGEVGVIYNYVGGPGTAFLQVLHEGDALEFKGPFGHFTLKEDSTRDVLFVATGTGIVPFYSMLVDWLPKGIDRQFTLLWGVRHDCDLYFVDELRALEKQYPNFRFLVTLSQPNEPWDGLKGRVTAVFPDYFPTVDNLEVYVCGNDGMIQEIKTLCAERGECPFYREKYF